jgi:plasmid stabilization system protein ParE
MLPITVTHRAAAQIEMAAEWWAVNRPKAPETLYEEIRRGFALICRHPTIGSRATNANLAGVRRIHLSRIRYFLYYRVHRAASRCWLFGIPAAEKRRICKEIGDTG